MCSVRQSDDRRSRIFIARVSCAVLCGLLIGIERQITGHTAGIRINVLVSTGACMFALFPMVLGDTGDFTRVAAQIVSGVGFLCSGIIFKDGLVVRGLNTAATIWCTAAIGVLVSSGKLCIGIAATVLLLLANLALRPFADLIRPLDCFDENEYSYMVSITCQEHQEFQVRAIVLNILKQSKLLVTNLESSDVIGSKVEIEATLLCRGKRRDDLAEALVATIGAEQGITSTGWRMME